MRIYRSLLRACGALTLVVSSVLIGSTAAGAADRAPTSSSTATSYTTYVTGTVQSGVEGGCTALSTPWGMQYTLIGGDPTVLRPGAQVVVYGQVQGGVYSTCVQGYPLQVITAWGS